MTGVPGDAPDPGELLQALRPRRTDEYLAPGDDPQADALLQQLMSLDLGTHRTRTRARRIAALTVGITVVGASATAALMLSRSAGNPTVLSCYSSAEVTAGAQVVIVPDRDRTPVEQCADLWSDGRISTDGAPPLVACVTTADIVAVIPGDASTCTAMGWVVAAIAPDAHAADPTSALPDMLSNRFGGQCLDLPTAVKAVEDVFVELEVVDWTVRDSTTDSDSCTVAVVDVDARTVELVSRPG